MTDAPAVVGRVLLASLFVIGGVRHFFKLPAITGMVAARGLPFPREGLIVVSLAEIVCGLLLAAGVWAAPAALGLIAFVLAAGVVALNFWDQEGPVRDLSISIWMSNVALIGGLLLAIAASR